MVKCCAVHWQRGMLNLTKKNKTTTLNSLSGEGTLKTETKQQPSGELLENRLDFLLPHTNVV